MKDKENVNFYLNFNCFRMFESGSNLIRLQMQKVEFFIPFKIQQA